METTEKPLLTKLSLPVFICLPGNCWFFGLAMAPRQNKASFSSEDKERWTASTNQPYALTPLIWSISLISRFTEILHQDGKQLLFLEPIAWSCPSWVRKRPKSSHSGGFTVMQPGLLCTQHLYLGPFSVVFTSGPNASHAKSRFWETAVKTTPSFQRHRNIFCSDSSVTSCTEKDWKSAAVCDLLSF